MRRLRQDYASIPLSSGCSALRRVLVLAVNWICPSAIRELPETANPITECDCVRSYRRSLSADMYAGGVSAPVWSLWRMPKERSGWYYTPRPGMSLMTYACLSSRR
jgi:hypothetical protein